MNQSKDPAAEPKQVQPDPSKSPSPSRPYGGYPPYGYPSYGYGYGYGYGGYYGSGSQEGGDGGDHGIFGAITVSRLWRLLWHRKVTVIGVAAFGLMAAYYYVQKTTTEVYQASSVIEMSLRKPRILDTKGAFVDQGYASSEEAFNTRLAKFKTPGVLASVTTELRKLRPADTRSDAQLQGLLGGISINMRSGTRLVDMTFQSTDPQFAADVANAYANAAEPIVLEENKATSEKAVAWLESQATIQQKLITEADTGLARYRAENNLDVLEGQKSAVQQSLASLSGASAGLASEIVLRSELLAFLVALKVKPDTAGTLPSGIPAGDRIAQGLAERNAARATLESLSKRYTAEHPDIKVAQARADAAEALLLEAIAAGTQSVAMDLDLLKKQAAGLQNKVSDEQRKLADLERVLVGKHAQITALERERDACDIAYRGILSRIVEAKLSADENTAIVKLIEPASVPSAPIKKRALPLLVFGLLLGTFGGFALAMASDTLEDRVSSLADVERVIGVKVLGLIPHISGVKCGELATASLDQKHGQITESFAGLRSLLNSAQYREAAKSILITSSAPEEGKTIVSCNLAIGSAKSGLKTLLIDFDMRRPRLGGIFTRPEEGRSLLKVLADGGDIRFDELPMPTECENLQVISTRSTDEGNPAEAMAGKGVEALLQWAKSRYDRVIVDSPPFGIVSDSAVLSTLVGGVIVICRPDKTRRRPTRHAVRHFTDMGATVIGAIVNDVHFGQGSYFSGEYYQQPYYYRYRHGYYDTKSGKKNRRSKREAGASATPAVSAPTTPAPSSQG